MKIEEELGFRSSFNFVPGDYDVPMELINELKTRGFEAGLHGLHHNGNIFRSKKIFLKHIHQIKKFCQKWDAVGFRAPSMYHNLEWLHDLDVELIYPHLTQTRSNPNLIQPVQYFLFGWKVIMIRRALWNCLIPSPRIFCSIFYCSTKISTFGKQSLIGSSNRAVWLFL